MNRSAVVLLSCVLLLSIVSYAALADEDFQVNAASAIDAFRCIKTTHTFALTNTGTVPSIYNVGLGGSAADWTDVPARFTLAPQKSTQVSYTLDTPCDAKGSKELSFTFSTDSGLEQTIVQTVTINIPQDINITPTVYKNMISPCGTATYSFVLQNPAPFQESYAIQILNPSALKLQVTPSDKKAVLDPQQSKSITFDVKAMDCMQSGDAQLTLKVDSTITQLSAELDNSLSVSDNGIATVGANVQRIVTGYKPSTGTIDITNNGATKATYQITAKGPSWVTVNPAQLELAAGQTSPLTVTMVPSNTTAQGDYHLNVTATVGKAAYSKDVAIRLYEPSWLTRQFTEHLGRTLLIAIAAIVVLFIIIAIIVRIYGHFTSEEHAQKKADKKRLRAEREAERQKLRQAQEKEAERKRREAEAARKKEETRIQKEIEHRKREDEKRQSDEYFARATAAAERELRKKNVLVARRTLEGRETSYRWVWFLVLLLLVAAVAVVAWLYPWIWQTYPLYVAIGVGIAIILILVLILEEYARGKRQRVFRFKALNKGKRTLATSWNTGVNELTLAVKQVLAKCRLCIRRGRKPSAFMAYEGMAYDYFTIEGKDIEDKDVDGIKVRFAVKKSWLRRNNINPDKVRLAHFTDAWRTTTAEVIGEDKKKVYYSADASFGNYAIVAKVAGKARKSAAWSWVLSIFILLILIGGSYALTFFATPQVVPAIVPGTKGIAPQYWPMNTDHTLALSTWFVDPDNDTLAYTYTPVQDIIVTVTNSVATFSPNKDFLGERTIQFTASDGKGGKVKSNEVRLVVYQPPTPTPLGMIGTFCTQYLLYIAIVAVVLVVIILGFEYRAPLKKFLDED